MPEMTEDYFVYPRMVDLAACVCEELAARNLPATCFCGVTAGGPPALETGDCANGNGMAWVRLITGFPSVRFPVQSIEPRCTNPLAFQLEVGIVRAVPVNKDGRPLTVDQQMQSTRLQMADMAAMLAAIRCCMGKHDPVDDDLNWLVGAYTPLGAQGGLVGGSWAVYVTQGVRSV